MSRPPSSRPAPSVATRAIARARSVTRGVALGIALGIALGVAPAPAVAIEAVSVVTPATPRQWQAFSGGLVVMPTFSDGADRAIVLQRWAKDDRFDLATRMQRSAMEAIAKRERLALPLHVNRPAQVEPSSLARDMLPQTALPGPILDISVEGFGVSASTSFVDFKPYVRVGWRLLDGKGAVLLPKRVVYYRAKGFMDSVTAPHAVVLTTDPQCAWAKFEAIAKERQRFWACMGDGLDRIAESIADEVAKSVR